MTIGVAVLAAPGEPLEACLRSVAGTVDQIAVFTWDAEQSRTARTHGADVISITPVDHVEPVRQHMQSALGTDWVLMLDPDETVEPGSLALFRERTESAGSDLVGFWVPYRMVIHGAPLRHSFARLRQLKLFRRDRVYYPGGIHEPPEPLDGHFEYLDETAPGIEHHFVTDLRSRFERHLRWAYIEAQEAVDRGVAPVMGGMLLTKSFEELAHYTVAQRGLNDGTVGAINALMHAWKTVASLCFIWELQAARNEPIERVNEWERFLANMKLP